MLEELMPRVEHYESADDVRAFMLANRPELPEPDAVARVAFDAMRPVLHGNG